MTSVDPIDDLEVEADETVVATLAAEAAHIVGTPAAGRWDPGHIIEHRPTELWSAFGSLASTRADRMGGHAAAVEDPTR